MTYQKQTHYTIEGDINTSDTYVSLRDARVARIGLIKSLNKTVNYPYRYNLKAFKIIKHQSKQVA